jgi:glycosyltransferase involved in cell wall biosynthesis
MVDAFYAGAAKVLVISPGMVDVLVSRGVPRDRLDLVYNWSADEDPPSERAPRPGLRSELALGRDAFVVMYAGNLGAAQGLDTAVSGVAQLPVGSPVHLVVVGDGVEKEALAGLALRVAPSRVHFLDPLPRPELLNLMEEADAHLVSLAPQPLFAVTMPSKLQSILASGRPVLGCATGDVARVIEASGAGLTCPPGDPAAFAAAAAALAARSRAELHTMGRSGRAYYDAHMSAVVGSARLLEHLLTAAAEKRPRTATAPA